MLHFTLGPLWFSSLNQNHYFFPSPGAVLLPVCLEITLLNNSPHRAVQEGDIVCNPVKQATKFLGLIAQ